MSFLSRTLPFTATSRANARCSGPATTSCGRFGVVAFGVVPKTRREDASRRPQYGLANYPSVTHRRGQFTCTQQSHRHLDVHTGFEALHRVVCSTDPVAGDEAFERPLVAKDVGQKHFVLACEGTIDGVIRTHHRVGARVDDRLEVRQVHLVQRMLIDDDVDLEAGILN